MNELRIDEHRMPAARIGPASPLVPFYYDTAELVRVRRPGPGLTDEDVRYLGYGYVHGCLPYHVQDDYDRSRQVRSFPTAVLENDRMKATFLLGLGGRLWSLVHKPSGRELMHVNPVFQPANLALRNAWFSGGSEWNFGWIGHGPHTCSPLFAARVEADDGTAVLRMWEWERVRQMPFQIDAWLPDDAAVLLVRVRLINHHDHVVPVYWWSNVAVPEAADTRVLAPAHDSYQLREETMELHSYPVHDGVDTSYPLNRRHSGDRFFRIPPGRYPWIASIDGRGQGFFHSSTTRLNGRKLWVFGHGAGGRQWQDYLNTPGHPYIEIQGGLTHTQAECLPMPAGNCWEWLEAYGALDVDPAVAHGKDWPAAVAAAEDRISAEITLERLERTLAESASMASRPPAEMLQRGSGWGTLELRRRKRTGEPPFGEPALVFDEQSLGAEQAPWLALLEEGALPEAPVGERPVSWMTQDEWRRMLTDSIDAGASDHWLGWLHLGIMHFAGGRHDEAAVAWRTSLDRAPSAWAYRNLAALAALRGDAAEAARLYPKAVELAPGEPRLLLECGKA
ncbi:MAG TPA: DUF5107 domain-containing protein, partial [Phycisphaerae bacterium]|nr:DUF5107 domain-containing protein [Phycisphaerae bacterium]